MTTVLPSAPEDFSNADALSWVAEGGVPLMAHHPGLPFADDECAHGRLPGDRTRPCGCWPGEVPDLMSTLKAAKEAATMTNDPEAPWGRKKDGSPKARPGRRPKAEQPTLAAVPDPPAPEPEPDPKPPSADPLAAALDTLAEKHEKVAARVRELRAEIDRLHALEDELVEAEADEQRFARALEALAEVSERPLAVAA